jgi:hypothetical protein
MDSFFVTPSDHQFAAYHSRSSLPQDGLYHGVGCFPIILPIDARFFDIAQRQASSYRSALRIGDEPAALAK